jgi:hypothetical protein
VLDAYEAAVGGRAAWEALKSLALKGVLHSEGQTLELRVTRAPGRLAVEAKDAKGVYGSGYDGKVGWRRSPDGVFALDEGTELAKLQRDSDLLFPVRVRDREVSPGGRSTIGSVRAIVVRVGGRQSPVQERLFFDPQTHLLLRRLVLTETLLGRLPEQTDYADYRAVAGVKIPFKVEETDVRGSETEVFEDAKANVSVDETLFAKPVVPAPKP